MIEKITFTQETGTNAKHEVTVYALSTCGFCKSCLKFLHDKSVQFRYVYYDLLDPEVKSALKEELNEKYKERIMFPFVIIDDKHVVTGFKEDKLITLLELQ
ncbi:MAG: glutaredoxin [Candidatus Lokiarchaeota archaeon]|nr:glutaredoxin [Candidatus Lokiarchaeota archaeon]